MTTLFIATRNAHKVDEIRAILGGQFHYQTLKDLPEMPAVVEDAPTFTGNAAKKAIELARWLSHSNFKLQTSNFLVLADDSGLEVDALGGAPGVYSARFAALDSGKEGNSPDADNNAKLLRLLADVPAEKRTARFRCVIALAAAPEERIENASPVCYAEEATLPAVTFDGTCEGRIEFAPHGTNGFGYDPLFIPDGYTESFAQLGEDVKNRLSHRAKALAKLDVYLKNRVPSD